ncbi:hypothetical protein GCM10022395_10650 [Snuella lapsa]|uniref:Uncharacterized protein n=1 Tax=Snuella lapsa TaxID=870481 RepID=A0ABP6XBA0_9FLAO
MLKQVGIINRYTVKSFLIPVLLIKWQKDICLRLEVKKSANPNNLEFVVDFIKKSNDSQN